VEIIFW